jgi:hypothetical protein
VLRDRHAALRRVLGGVVEQVADDLRRADRVDLLDHRLEDNRATICIGSAGVRWTTAP